MKIFDSISNRKWSGKWIILNKSSILLKSNGSISHKITLSKGHYIFYLFSKKRSGNGKYIVNISDNNGRIFLSEKIETNRILSEKKISFTVPSDSEDSFLILKRDSNSFGSVEVERIKIVKEDNKEDRVNIEKEKKKRMKNIASSVFPSFYKRRIAVVVPYNIYGGAEVYLKRIMDHGDLEGFHISFLFLGKNKLMNMFKKENISTKLCRGIDSLRANLISNNYDQVIYYNRADVYRLLHSLKSTIQIDSSLVEIYHSDFEWPGSLSKIKKREGVNAFVTVSDTIGRDISGSFSNIETIPVGVDLSQFSKIHKDDNLKKKLRAGRDRIIGTVARISSEKNIEYVLELALEIKNYTFVIVGDGPLLKPLMALARDKEIDNVKFLGFKNDVHNYYPNFDAFLLPSKMEGTPISIIEAMASETLVFSSSVGGIPDILQNKKTGYFITGNLKKDKKIITSNIDDKQVVDAAKKYVIESHDIKKNASSFVKIMADSKKSFSEVEEGEHLILLNGSFI